jgi:hypothetical protein
MRLRRKGASNTGWADSHSLCVHVGAPCCSAIHVVPMQRHTCSTNVADHKHEAAACLLDPRSESNELQLWHRQQHPSDCSEVRLVMSAALPAPCTRGDYEVSCALGIAVLYGVLVMSHPGRRRFHVNVHTHSFSPSHRLACALRRAQVTRFYVYRPGSMGLGAVLFSAAAALRQAVNDNRVFLMDDRWTAVSSQGIVDPSPGGRIKCPNNNATIPWECYFRPVSSCSIADALALANVSSVDELMSNRWESTRTSQRVCFSCLSCHHASQTAEGGAAVCSSFYFTRNVSQSEERPVVANFGYTVGPKNNHQAKNGKVCTLWWLEASPTNRHKS